MNECCVVFFRRCKKISPCLSCYTALNFITWFQIFIQFKKNIYESFAIVRKWNSRKTFLILSHFHDQPVQNMRNKYLPDAFSVVYAFESSRHMLLLNIAHDSIFEWKVIYERAKMVFILISLTLSACMCVQMFVNYCSECWRQKTVYMRYKFHTGSSVILYEAYYERVVNETKECEWQNFWWS